MVLVLAMLRGSNNALLFGLALLSLSCVTQVSAQTTYTTRPVASVFSETPEAKSEEQKFTESDGDTLLELLVWKKIRTLGLLGSFEWIRDDAAKEFRIPTTRLKLSEDAKQVLLESDTTIFIIGLEIALIRLSIGSPKIGTSVAKELGDVEEELIAAKTAWRGFKELFRLYELGLKAKDKWGDVLSVVVKGAGEAKQKQGRAERNLRRILQRITTAPPDWLLIVPPTNTAFLDAFTKFSTCSEIPSEAERTNCLQTRLTDEEQSYILEKMKRTIEQARESSKAKLNQIWLEGVLEQTFDSSAHLTQWEEVMGFGSAETCRSWQRKAGAYYQRNKEKFQPGTLDNSLFLSARFTGGKCVPADAVFPLMRDLMTGPRM